MRLLRASLLVVLVSACADDQEDTSTTTQPSAEDYAHVAASIAATVAHDGGEIAAMRQAVALAHDRDEAGFVRTADGAYVGAMSGLSYRYDIACADAGGEGLAPCDRTSNHANVTATWTGTSQLADQNVTLDHDATWQLTRMTGAIAHIDGIGHVDYQTQTFGTLYSYGYDASYHVVVNDVRAIEGAIQFTITGTHAGKGNAQYTMTGEVTFLPDDTGTLVLDDSHHYALQLATGEVTPQS